MHLRVSQIRLPLSYDEKKVIQQLSRKLSCHPKEITSFNILRRSIDARNKQKPPFYSMVVECELKRNKLPGKCRAQDIRVIETVAPADSPQAKIPSTTSRPVVVGAGPAGLMAAVKLAQAGLKPILIERGSSANEREDQVATFWKHGTHIDDSNVLYGEGGAGLFSDGKLTARSKDNNRMNEFFEMLVECGAPEEIMIDSLPHVGSDLLLGIVPKLRKKIIDLGGEVRFNAKLEQLHFDGPKLSAVTVNGEKIVASECILAVGHSARDVYDMLYKNDFKLEPKAFAIGVRVEIPQKKIDRAQYGKWCHMNELGAASYRLTRRAEDEARGCYSFCMCPGGIVIPCVSEAGYITSNGMSLSKRDEEFSNAAFLVPVEPEDFPKGDFPEYLAGVEFQREIEKKAFELAGPHYHLPAMRLVDLLADRESNFIPTKRSYLNALATDLRKILPDFVITTLKSALPKMIKKLHGITVDDVLLYGPETRSSSPVRIVRDEAFQAVDHQGVYPAGEGAGYAGGIVSSAIDGIKAAEALVNQIITSPRH